MKKKYSIIPFLIILIIANILSLYLFYRFCNTDYELFVSDFQWHLLGAWSFVNNDILPLSKQPFPALFSYPLYHLLTAILGKLINRIDISASLIVMISNIFTSIILRNIGNKEFSKIKEKYLIDFISISILFIMPISGILTNYKPFFPQMSVNPWHNPTYLFMRPFTIICFIIFIDIIKNIKENNFAKKNILKLIGLCISLVITTLAKPSFTLFFLFAAGIYTFYCLFPDFKRNLFKAGIPIFLAVLPTLILLLWQQNLVLTYSKDISFDTKLLPIKYLIDNGFLYFRYFLSLQILNLIFFIAYGRKLLFKDISYTLSFLMLISTLFIWFFTTQGIYSLSNFAWSYEIATFYTIFYSIIYTIKYLKKSKISYFIWIIYIIFLYYGVKYFSYLLTGWNFAGKF